jgi:hypothetical protein
MISSCGCLQRRSPWESTSSPSPSQPSLLGQRWRKL